MSKIGWFDFSIKLQLAEIGGILRITVSTIKKQVSLKG